MECEWGKLEYGVTFAAGDAYIRVMCWDRDYGMVAARVGDIACHQLFHGWKRHGDAEIEVTVRRVVEMMESRMGTYHIVPTYPVALAPAPGSLLPDPISLGQFMKDMIDLSNKQQREGQGET